MSTALEDHTLMLLRHRFLDTLPWFCRATGASVTVRPLGRGNSFCLHAAWAGGEYQQVFDAVKIRELGRRGCARRLSELFVAAVLRARGQPAEDDESC